jgi:ribosomal protein S2
MPKLLASEKRWIRDQVIADYANGLSVWRVAKKYQGMATQKEVREWLAGTTRRKGCFQVVGEEEVAQRKLEVQANWTPEQASKRWVGRLLTRPETMHSSASRLLPD